VFTVEKPEDEDAMTLTPLNENGHVDDRKEIRVVVEMDNILEPGHPVQ